ncbi:unnamed protein product [Trichobilharzia szidati]|nr:unnamed protein product [Trichobilharzia szidati]
MIVRVCMKYLFSSALFKSSTGSFVHSPYFTISSRNNGHCGVEQLCNQYGGGVLLTYFTIQKVYVGVLMTYSFLFGTGVGLGFSVTLAVAATWFPEQRGLVVGLVVSGYGMGSLVFGPIQTALINPHNVRVNNVTRQFDNKEMLDRLPDAFLILGGILLATQIIGFIFLRPKPKMEAVEEIKETASEKSSTKYETEDDEVQIYSCYPDSLDVTPAQLFRHIDFYLLWFIELCNSVMLTVVTSAYKLFGQTFISDDQYLTAAVTVAAVFNALGRILWGSAVDRFSYKIPLLIISLTWAILLLSFPFISTASEFTAKALFCFYGIGNFLFLSSISTIAPATVGSMFGCKHMAVNYGILASAREVQIYSCYPDSLDVTSAQLFRHIDFYLLWFIELCNSVMLTVVTSAYKLFGQTFISDDQYLTAAVTVAAVFNALGRILWGSAVDRFSYKIPLLIISLTWAILLLSFPFISTASEFTAKALFCFYGIGNFLFLSSISTIAPATVGSMFGCKHMAVNYGILASARTIGCPLCAFVLTYIITKDPYLLQFTVCGCSSLIAFFLTLWIDDHKIHQRLNCCSPCSRTCQSLRIQRS